MSEYHMERARRFIAGDLSALTDGPVEGKANIEERPKSWAQISQNTPASQISRKVRHEHSGRR